MTPKPRDDDGFSPLWPRGAASRWWLAVGFAGGVVAVTAVTLLMLMEELA